MKAINTFLIFFCRYNILKKIIKFKQIHFVTNKKFISDLRTVSFEPKCPNPKQRALFKKNSPRLFQQVPTLCAYIDLVAQKNLANLIVIKYSHVGSARFANSILQIIDS